MNPFLRRFAFYGCVVAFCLSALPLWGQIKASSRSGTSSEGELVNPGDNPAVRYPVAHFSGSGLFASFDYGWLSFSRDTIRYEVVRGDKG
ncbi:MAG TPA: hypothetical protein VGQ94_04820, partial [Terriglobales bacterium]|nr:hypothetical protein [Terriglobales bacterium]